MTKKDCKCPNCEPIEETFEKEIMKLEQTKNIPKAYLNAIVEHVRKNGNADEDEIENLLKKKNFERILLNKKISGKWE